jgi:hypothetical protein
VQLGVDQMHLAEIWLRRILGDPGPVLHGRARVGIAFDADPFGDTHAR